MSIIAMSTAAAVCAGKGGSALDSSVVPGASAASEILSTGKALPTVVESTSVGDGAGELIGGGGVGGASTADR